MSHRLHRLILIPVIALCVMGLALSNHRDAEVAETLIVDFSKKPFGNPYQELYEKMLYPTVRIKTGLATGSGVIFNRRGAKDAEAIYILTAAHVVDDYSNVIVELFYPKNIELEASVIITDTNKDLALLRALCGSAVHSAQLAPESYTPHIFTPVYTVGCSLGLPPRPSQGIITYISVNQCESAEPQRSPDRSVGASYWEVSSPILPGNSGGPVFDARTCEVIGIAIWVHTYNNQIVTTMAGIVPIHQIYEFLTTKNTKGTK